MHAAQLQDTLKIHFNQFHTQN
jgi:hypothetical protein